MNLETLSNIFGIIESLAVLGSLYFILKQIKDNTAAVKGATYQSIVATYVDFEAKFIENPEISRLYSLAYTTPDDLSQEDKAKIIRLMSGYFNLYENLFYQYKNGLLEPELWAGWSKGLMVDLYAQPGLIFWWKRTSKYYSKEFREHIEKGSLPRKND